MKKMKSYISVTTILSIALSILSCAGPKEINDPEKNNDMHSINSLMDKIELKVGEKAVYAGTVHGSVGTQKECWSGDETILKLIDKDFEYHKQPVEGETGGDRATETYTFEALAVGETTVTIQNWFRGDLEKESIVKIIVTK